MIKQQSIYNIEEEQNKNIEQVDSFYKKKLYYADFTTYSYDEIEELNKEFDGDVVEFQRDQWSRVEHFFPEKDSSLEFFVNACEDGKIHGGRFFSKEVKRQNYFEKTFHKELDNVIKEVNDDLKMKNLNNKISIEADKNEMHFVIDKNGKLTTQDEKKIYDDGIKTFDFRITLRKNRRIITIFTINKYTSEGGGIQDDIKGEMYRTLDAVKKYKDKDVYFMFILDGDYWKKEKNKITVNDNNDNIIITDEFDFRKSLNSIIYD